MHTQSLLVIDCDNKVRRVFVLLALTSIREYSDKGDRLVEDGLFNRGR